MIPELFGVWHALQFRKKINFNFQKSEFRKKGGKEMVLTERWNTNCGFYHGQYTVISQYMK